MHSSTDLCEIMYLRHMCMFVCSVYALYVVSIYKWYCCKVVIKYQYEKNKLEITLNPTKDTIIVDI